MEGQGPRLHAIGCKAACQCVLSAHCHSQTRAEQPTSGVSSSFFTDIDALRHFLGKAWHQRNQRNELQTWCPNNRSLAVSPRCIPPLLLYPPNFHVGFAPQGLLLFPAVAAVPVSTQGKAMIAGKMQRMVGRRHFPGRRNGIHRKVLFLARLGCTKGSLCLCVHTSQTVFHLSAGQQLQKVLT